MTRPGDFVGAYQLVRHLGEGPFGMVWLARAPSSPGTRALKLLRPGFVERPEGQEAFSRLLASVEIHGRLHHPNLAEIYEAVEDAPKRLFGVGVALVEGQTLADTTIPTAVLQGQDLRGLATILSWFEELGAALSWLHAQRIVHGNLKPTNVMLTQHQGRSVVKVLDLCWAAIGIAAPPANASWSVSPEQLLGQPPTKESDQWMVASMLTRMLSGGYPQLRAGVMPQMLISTLARALDASPHRRYPSMAELVGALRSIRTELEQLAREPGALRAANLVDPYEFADEPETVRRTLGDLENTDREADLPLVPNSRALSKEISDENMVPPLGLSIGGPPRGIEESFDGPLVPDDFSRVTSKRKREDADLSTRPPARARSASRLTVFGVLFFVIAGGIIAAAVAMVGGDPETEETAKRTASVAAQPADVAPPPPEVIPPPPPVEDPPPVEAAPPPPPAPAIEKTEPEKREKPKAKPPARRPGEKDLENLDEKADQALAKLLGEPVPEGESGARASDRELSVACDEGDGQACVDLGDRLAKKKIDRAANAFERACRFSVAEGCHRAALLVREKEKSARLEVRACELGRKLSCKTTETSTSS